jgi:hypothetical protein
MQRASYAVLCGLLLALITPAVAGEPWFRIQYDNSQRDLRACLVEPDGPRGAMRLADMEHLVYRMEDITEQGQVVQTTMVGRGFRTLDMEPLPLEGNMTWYRGKERCEAALRGFREAAKQESQRRERYR